MSRIIEKTCSGPCNLTKPVTEFYVDRTNKDQSIGYRNKCKACASRDKAKYYKKNSKKICKRSSEYREINPDYAITWRKSNPNYNSEYRIANSEHILAYKILNKDSIKIQRAQYYQDNKTTIAEYTAQYRLENPDKIRANKARRRAAKLQRTPAWANLKTIKQVYADCAEINLAAKTAGCTEVFVVDHIIPLVGKLVSGLHVEYNLDIITNAINCSKSNSFIPG